MVELDAQVIQEAARKQAFTGVVTVHVADERSFDAAYGFAHRGFGVPTSSRTQFAIASGSKAFTALAVVRLVADGVLRLDQPVREILGADLPLIDDRVTIEHLLAHTSGIGDYLDEDGDWDPADFVLAAPVHTLVTAETFLPLVDGFPQKFSPGERFSYCNGGYIALAVVLERVTGETYHEVVRRTVIEPAGLERTGFLRLDELPGTAAVGYVFDQGDATNTLRLPVLGNGDGGAFTTADDLHGFWRAFHAGRIVPPEWVAEMTRPRVFVPDERKRYGLGLWLHRTAPATVIEGYDAGVSFRSTHIPATATTASVLGNSSEGGWPVIGAVTRAVDAAVGADAV